MYAGEDALAVLEVEEADDLPLFDQIGEEELIKSIRGDAGGNNYPCSTMLV